MDVRPQGYLHSEVDIKVLILFILARIDTPLSGQEIYEVAYQDESLNYFTFFNSLPELVLSGHIRRDERDRYVITDLGRTQGAQVEDSLAVPVVRKVSAAIAVKQIQLRREGSITASVEQDGMGHWIAALHYQDDGMPMMELSLMAPNEEVAAAMADNLRRQADLLYQTNLNIAIEDKRRETP